MKTYLLFRRISLLVLLMYGTGTTILAQNPFSQCIDSVLANQCAIDTSLPLSFSFQSQAFLKNNEFFGVITEGYTLFGYWANPSLKYQLTNELSLRTGIWIQKYFGLDTFSHVSPSYTASYAPSPHFLLEIGDLSWNLEDVVLPLRNEERMFASPQHEGLLMRINRKHFYASTWIEWDEFLFHNENKQEEQNLCANYKLFLVRNDFLTLSIPFQAVVHHKGGQINSIPKKDLVMVLNNAAGGDVTFALKDVNVGFKYFFCGFADLASAPYSHYKNGLGHLAMLDAKFRNYSVGYSYWAADQYLSALGTQMLNTVSDIPGDLYYEQKRNLSMLYCKYQKHISSNAYFSVGGMGYFDHNNDAFEYYYWFNLAVDFERKIFFFQNKAQIPK